MRYEVAVIDRASGAVNAISSEEAPGFSQAAAQYAERFAQAQFKRQETPLLVIVAKDDKTFRFDVDICWDPRVVGITWLREEGDR